MFYSFDLFFQGVALKNFDCVSIDSDLDTIGTQQVRAHAFRCSGEKQDGKKIGLIYSLVGKSN